MKKFKLQKGQMLVELLMAIGLSAIFLPALATGLLATTEGKVQQTQRMQAVTLLKESEKVVKAVRDNGWSDFSSLITGSVYHPEISGTKWSLTAGIESVNGFTRQIVINNVNRDSNGAIVTSGGTVDPSTKRADITISWTNPFASQITSTMYLTRTSPNFSHTETTSAQFSAGTLDDTQVATVSGGEVKLESNKAKWCSPSFATNSNGTEITVDLPDGPPVAVVATASSNLSTPNDVFVATAPTTGSTTKMAYVNITQNSDPPVASQRGRFTMESGQYSSGTFPSGTGLSNSFKTNDIKYYKSSSGKTYALIATDIPDKEVVAVQINDGNGDAYQDPVNKIYKYWTYFNTKMYQNSTVIAGAAPPSANAAETSNAGDNNGYASNPIEVYQDENGSAVDSNSGNNTGTSCTGNDKDKHQFYNFGLSVPSGASVNGVEVRLDAEADSTSGSPQICIQLSWDGGTTWTTAKTTSTLTTNLQTYTLGGSSDAWGRTWNPTEFSNSNFRVRVINVSSNTSRDFSLDYLTVKLYGDSAYSNDYSPNTYGATALTVLGDRGYVAVGGYLYTFNLANIDSKSTSSNLDQIGCRIELNGYECLPGSPAVDKKYSAGEAGGTWNTNGSAAHNDCSDGGNIELYATNDLSGVQTDGHNYIFTAVGAGTNPEFEIVDVTNVPDGSSSPAISSNSCGRISGGNSGWKVVGTYDFNTDSGTEEAANSVFAKSDGSRAYISSNGTSDSKQFYILNTNTKSSPSFLTGNPGSGPGSGFYQSGGANGEMYPRRSLTVLDGKRAVLVGKDGVSNSNNAQEYQVLDMDTDAYSEDNPGYCGGLDFNTGFTGLTSVSEADGDNFVYMITSGGSNELKIIQGGPDQDYLGSGIFESQTFNAGASESFNHFVANLDPLGNTSFKMQVGVAQGNGSCSDVASFPFIGPDGTSSTYFTSTGASVSGTIPFGTYSLSPTSYQNPANCFRYKAWFTSSPDFRETPILKDVSWNYSQ